MKTKTAKYEALVEDGELLKVVTISMKMFNQIERLKSDDLIKDAEWVGYVIGDNTDWDMIGKFDGQFVRVVDFRWYVVLHGEYSEDEEVKFFIRRTFQQLFTV